MQTEEIETFYPQNQSEWRQWLEENHATKRAVWLLCYRKKSNFPTVFWSEAVDEALCFGWIDSVRKTIDEEKFIQFFSVRKPKGTWSKINKEKIIQLIEAGKMAPAGLAAIEKAKQNGSWTILDDVEELLIPDDLESVFAANPSTKEYFLRLSKSAKKAVLHRLTFAKRPETRTKRLQEIAELAAKMQKPDAT